MSSSVKRLIIPSLFIANLFIVIFFWWSNSGILLTKGLALALISLGRLAGLLAANFILLQFLLIGRSPWVERVFGLDKLAHVHRLNGYVSISTLLLHPLFLVIGNSLLTQKDVISQYLTFVTVYEGVLQSSIAIAILISTVFFSVYIVRKHLKYETWYYIHVFNYLAVYLAWNHQLKNGEDFIASNAFVLYWYALYTFVLLNHLIFRFLRPLYLFSKHKFAVEKIVKESGEANSVYITGEKLDQFKVQPGQFMKYRFLTKGMWWQDHPFSFSKFPDGKTIRSTIKNVGDFTSEIPNLKKGTRVIIDGPYGIFTDRVAKKDKFLFIAGGIGITPLRSLSEEMGINGKNVVLLYSNKTKQEIVLKEELDNLSKKFTNIVIKYILSQEKTDDPLLSGRLDKDKIKVLVPDLLEREVYICGPVPMTNALRADLQMLGVHPQNIHFEKFSLH